MLPMELPGSLLAVCFAVFTFSKCVVFAISLLTHFKIHLLFSSSVADSLLSGFLLSFVKNGNQTYC